VPVPDAAIFTVSPAQVTRSGPALDLADVKTKAVSEQPLDDQIYL
jgi:hypothetical protein